ncbi:MAG TPA: helix-turn-helix domain-containing protein [Candidatus Methylomirabilis sp.]|nr:helix-turn-helix domain-containing protein [Candidatus Methylomirabilis sp.]HSB81714.1 helix-turn-helix domain-containing protein [Candidatus Methylomirabilis sp.]
MMAFEERPGPGSLARSPFRGQERSLGKVREEAEKEYILSVLKLTEGRRGQAAQILGISRKTLWKKLKHLGVS